MDQKGIKNVVVNHLSRLTIDLTFDRFDIWYHTNWWLLS
jgi:hypothetical protein